MEGMLRVKVDDTVQSRAAVLDSFTYTVLAHHSPCVQQNAENCILFQTMSPWKRTDWRILSYEP